ncbi:MAG TPA: diguanylate cyclase [bacterium]|nr:diguanylate cyclase [bacterium]HOL47883.1 diguanylate cyclase [bacterium]HPQ19679.1 diguanylate cyclase [bacterium]
MYQRKDKPVLSYSKIEIYSLCPLKYKYQYIDAFASKFKKEQPYFSLGESIHTTLYDFFKLPKEKRTFENLKNLLKKNWIRAGYKDSIEERDYAHKGLNILTNFYNTFDIMAEPLFLEKNFSIDFGKFKLWGKIDRIDKINGNEKELEIIDYKTSNYLPSIEEVKNDMQLLLYGVAIKKEFNIIPAKFSLIFLQHCEKLSVSFSEEDLISMEEYIKNIFDQIESDKKFAPNKNNLCYYCEFAEICPVMNPLISDEIQETNVSGNVELDSKVKLERIIYEKEKAVENLYLLNNAIQEFTKYLEKEILLKKIIEIIVSIIDSKYGMILIFDDNQLNIFYSMYLKENDKKLLFDFIKEEIKTLNKIKIIERDNSIDIFRLLRIEQLILLPLKVEEENKAIIVITEKSNGLKLNENEIIFLNTLITQASTALKNALLYELATTDGLTRLYIRRHFINRLKEEMSRTLRYKLSLSLIMLDIDHFKKFNDTYGHQIGDLVLKQFAIILKNSTRDIDIVGRYGGEEFIIALPDTNIEGAKIVAERIRQNVANYEFSGYAEPLKVTTSLGLTEFKEDDNDETLIKRADDALYQAKANGRNRYEINL